MEHVATVCCSRSSRPGLALGRACLSLPQQDVAISIPLQSKWMLKGELLSYPLSAAQASFKHHLVPTYPGAPHCKCSPLFSLLLSTDKPMHTSSDQWLVLYTKRHSVMICLA